MTQQKNPSNNKEGGDFISTRGRCWFVTINNYDDTTPEKFANENAIDIVFQTEVGSKGTPHIQGIVVYKNPIWSGAFRNRVSEKAYIVPLKSFHGGRKYCCKEDTYDGKARFIKRNGVVHFDWRRQNEITQKKNESAPPIGVRFGRGDDIRKGPSKEWLEYQKLRFDEWAHKRLGPDSCLSSINSIKRDFEDYMDYLDDLREDDEIL